MERIPAHGVALLAEGRGSAVLSPSTRREVKSAVEIQEVAQDVVERVDARKNTMKNALATSQ